jgi:pseudoazurin
MKLQTLLTAAAIAIAVPAAGFAEDHQVHMLNRGADGQMMVFEPAFLQIEPGDTVTFLPTDPSHNAESIPSMMPEGAETFRGRINQEITVTFDQEGVYGIKCLPHYGLGMVAVIQVGDDTANLEAARGVRHPARANQRMPELLSQVQE